MQPLHHTYTCSHIIHDATASPRRAEEHQEQRIASKAGHQRWSRWWPKAGRLATQLELGARTGGGLAWPGLVWHHGSWHGAASRRRGARESAHWTSACAAKSLMILSAPEFGPPFWVDGDSTLVALVVVRMPVFSGGGRRNKGPRPSFSPRISAFDVGLAHARKRNVERETRPSLEKGWLEMGARQ